MVLIICLISIDLYVPFIWTKYRRKTHTTYCNRVKNEKSFYSCALVEYIAGKKFKLRKKCHFEDEILNENLNESLPDLK